MKTHLVYSFIGIFFKFIVVNFRDSSLLKYVTGFSHFYCSFEVKYAPISYRHCTVEKLGFFLFVCCFLFRQYICQEFLSRKGITASQGCAFFICLGIVEVFSKVVLPTDDICSYS